MARAHGQAAVHADLSEAAGLPLFGDRPPGGIAEPLVSNARLALVLFIATETMLFIALLGVFVVFRVSSLTWPPPGQPFLPVGVTWVNTAILLLSAVTMYRGTAAIRAGEGAALRSWLAVTAALGSTFVLVQGIEWAQLISFGLTLSSSTYGATFYTLIGLHGLHVVGAVIWLLAVLAGAMGERYTKDRHAAVDLCGIYWYFVSGLWVVLFFMVYLN